MGARDNGGRTGRAKGIGARNNSLCSEGAAETSAGCEARAGSEGLSRGDNRRRSVGEGLATETTAGCEARAESKGITTGATTDEDGWTGRVTSGSERTVGETTETEAEEPRATESERREGRGVRGIRLGPAAAGTATGTSCQ